jgi:hypothetical protein
VALVTSGSSAKRVARLAQKGKGKKVRFQGGTVFPGVMAAVIIAGLLLVAYSRQSAPDSNTPPTINDHWHLSYGFYVCDSFLPPLVGTKEQPIDPDYLKYGVHSHDDGVIHWHPAAFATGTRAKLDLFFKVYDIEVTQDKIAFPADQNGGQVYDVDDYKCKDSSGKEVTPQIKMVVWDRYDDPGKGRTFITDFKNLRVDRDGMAFTVAIVAPGVDVPKPESAANLPELGAIDSGQAAPTTTVEGASDSLPSQTTTPGTPSTDAPTDTTGG